VEKDIPARATGALREERIKLGFQGKAAIYLPETSRYDYLAALPSGANVGEAIRDAMLAIEESVIDQNGNKLLAGALPKDYLGLERDLLAELVKIFNSPALAQATGDVFGRIYEYFLNQFAQSGAQEGGEFFTPPSLVRMIVNIIEPDHGVVLDPACGSAGMFVQTGHFIEEVRHQSTHDSIPAWRLYRKVCGVIVSIKPREIHNQGQTWRWKRRRAPGDFLTTIDILCLAGYAQMNNLLSIAVIHTQQLLL
jgi:type I restriction enzyme M protein